MKLRVRLVFPDSLVREPVLARLARAYPVEPNIRRASVDDHSGWIVCELSGSEADLEAALAYLTETGVRVEQLGDLVES